MANNRIAELDIEIYKITLPATDDPKYKELNEKLALLKQEKAELQKKLLPEGDLTKDQKQAEEKLKAAQDALKAEQAKDEKLNELIELAEQLETSEEELIQKVGKKADGYKWSRNQDLDVKAYLTGPVTVFTEKDIKQLVYQFCGQTDGSPTKLEYAKALANLDDTEFLNIATNRQMQVRDFAIKYVEKHSN